MRTGREESRPLRQLEKRLRELQNEYYDASVKAEPVIAQYLQTLADARRLSAAASPEAARGSKLHLGCGEHRLDGWLNVDLVPTAATDALADCAAALPFRDGSVAFIHCEDLLEHLELAGGKAFLRECFRVLRPGGVLRLLTPDLEAIVRNVYRRRESRHLAWCAAQLSARGPCESLNMHLRMNGEHRFLYDEAFLREILTGLGFRVRTVRWNHSEHSALRYLDLRDFGLNLFLEATRPS